jgi:hypothetical protein
MHSFEEVTLELLEQRGVATEAERLCQPNDRRGAGTGSNRQVTNAQEDGLTRRFEDVLGNLGLAARQPSRPRRDPRAHTGSAATLIL